MGFDNAFVAVLPIPIGLRPSPSKVQGPDHSLALEAPMKKQQRTNEETTTNKRRFLSILKH